MSNLKSKIQNPKSFAALRRFVRPRAPMERCDLCGAELARDHLHLFDPLNRQLVCACDICAISMGDHAGTPYRRVPRRIRMLRDFRLSEMQWERLLVPVGIAFFFYSTPAGRVMAFYPSPAGATESLLSLESWQEIVRENPILQTMEADVEALLVNRLSPHLAQSGGEAQHELIVPIDRCYELVGLIRTNWRGLSGGAEVWEEIAGFYNRLREQSA